jgi:hypothetical protein
MHKILVVVSSFLLVTPVVGQESGHRSGHVVGQRPGHPIPFPPHRPNDLVPPAIIPFVDGTYYTYSCSIRSCTPMPLHDCYDELVGYDRRGREIWQEICY